MISDNKTLVLIDSNAIIHRAYHALPKNMSTSKGELTNAVYGYATTLIKVLEDLKPQYIAASFDLAAPTFRHLEYAEYKGTRVKADQELYDQIPKVRELLSALNIPVYELAGYEADDVIGTIAAKFQITDNKFQVEPHNQISNRADFKVFIVTGDKDAFQLIDGNVFVYNLKHGLSNAQIVDRAVINKEWNLDPEDFIDLKALAGDPSDNIPGVPGIGGKTATMLLQSFDSLEGVYNRLAGVIEEAGLISKSEFLISNKIPNLNDQILKTLSKIIEIKPAALKALIENREKAFLSQRLATIRRDVPIDFKLEDTAWGDYDKEKVKDFFNRMQFHSLLRRFGAERGEEPKTKESAEQKKKDEQLKLL